MKIQVFLIPIPPRHTQPDYKQLYSLHNTILQRFKTDLVGSTPIVI